MLKNSTVKVDCLEDILTSSFSESRNTSFIPYDSDVLIQNNRKTGKNDISITSINAKHSTINEVLKEKLDYNEDIYIFEITGQTSSSSTVSWTIYKNYKQIKDLFEQIKKEISKRDDYVDENIIIKCKIVKQYTNGEIILNLDKIADYIIYIYNSTNPNHPESLREGLRISQSSFVDDDGTKPLEGYALKKAEPRKMRKVLQFLHLDHFFF